MSLGELLGDVIIWRHYHRRLSAKTRHRLLISAWMTSVLIMIALITIFTLRLSTTTHSSTASIRGYSNLTLLVVQRRSFPTTPSILSREFLCTGTRPLLLCTDRVVAHGLDRVKWWQYRLANDSDYASFLGRRHDTCALVGSSYSLKKKKYGAEIDAHDVVVRINDPPVKGYESHVGRRPADISIFNMELSRLRKKCARPSHSRSLLVQCSFAWNQPKDRKKLSSNAQCVDVTWKKFGVKTFIMSKYMFSIADRALEYERVRKSTKSVQLKPSCGLRSIIFLLHLCRNLHVYGFGGTKANEPYKCYSKESTSHSYWTALHDFAGERRFIDAFASGKLNRTELGLSWNGIGKLIVHR